MAYTPSAMRKMFESSGQWQSVSVRSLTNTDHVWGQLDAHGSKMPLHLKVLIAVSSIPAGSLLTVFARRKP